MNQRICSVSDCVKPHRARGLCSTHYNRVNYSADQRHPKIATPCDVCGTIIMRGYHPDRRPTCSVMCRTALQWGTLGGNGYDWANDAMRRASRAGCTVIEYVDRDSILQRDDYRCYICDLDTSLSQSAYEPGSPTVDHVVPLSKGGTHTPDNMRCCCLHCNSSKQAGYLVALA